MSSGVAGSRGSGGSPGTGAGAGAEFVEDGATRRPLNYGDTSAEYEAARRAAVVIDLSHRGRLRVTGRDRLDLIHRLTTNDMRDLHPGQGIPNLFLTNKGRIVEMFDVLAGAEDLQLLLLSSNAPGVAKWIEQFTFAEDVVVTDTTSETAEFGVFGPAAAAILGDAGAAVDDLRGRDHREAEIGGVRVRVGGAAPLAGGGYRIVSARHEGPRVWEAVAGGGARFGLRPAGAEVEEILRIEAAMPAPGRELSERWNPLEAELYHAISFTKGCYVGQEVVARLNTYEKVQRALRGLRVAGDQVPRSGSRVLASSAEAEAGQVTSAVRSPGLGAILALAYVERKYSEAGTTLAVEIEPGAPAAAAQVLAPPFVASEGTQESQQRPG